jgi:hypothetical protein
VLTPDIAIHRSTFDPVDEVEDMGSFIIKKIDVSHKTNQLRQKIIEKNNKQLHKSNLAMLVKCKQLLVS